MMATNSFNASSFSSPVSARSTANLVEDWVRIQNVLPVMRFANVLRLICLIDAVASVSLWLTAGTPEYDTAHSILFFNFYKSGMEIAFLAIARFLILSVAIVFVEDGILAVSDRQPDSKFTTAKRAAQTIMMIISFASFVYSIVKLALILTNKPNPSPTLEFYAQLGSSIAFSLLEFVVVVSLPVSLRNLTVIRQRRRFNAHNQEIDEHGEIKPQGTSLERVLALARPEVPLLAFGSLNLLISSGSQMAAPFFFGKVVDAAKHSMRELNQTVLIMFLIYVGGALASMLRAYCYYLAGQRLVARLRTHLLSAVLRQDIAFFDTNRTGELTNRLSSDTQVLQNAVTVNISMLVRYALQTVGSLIIMFVLNPALTGVLLAVVPVISLSGMQYGRAVRKMRKNFQDRLAEASTVAEEAISSIRTVRSFAGEERCTDDYDEKIQKSYQVGKKLALAEGAFSLVMGFLSYGGIALALWYGGKLVFENHITAGTLTAFLLYTLNVAIAFTLLSSLYGDFMQAVGASTRIFEILDKEPQIPLSGGLAPAKIAGNIQFENVHFTYPSRPDSEVLKSVSFSVQPGQVVALVGPSGGGKSTTVALLERLYDPDSGSIRIGGYAVSDIDPTVLRRRMSLVAQEPTLFACSISDNISWGRATASREEIIAAAKAANAHNFIMDFEDGYETTVGERGVRLSGGQKQRVAIARALLMNPVVLLLDEATSALDAESEHLVQEAIDNAMRGRTVLVIAHRLSTVRNANLVLVMQGGQLVERGTHEQLLAAGGVYRKLVLRQLMSGGAAAVPEAINEGCLDEAGSDAEYSSVVDYRSVKNTTPSSNDSFHSHSFDSTSEP